MPEEKPVPPGGSDASNNPPQPQSAGGPAAPDPATPDPAAPDPAAHDPAAHDPAAPASPPAPTAASAEPPVVRASDIIGGAGEAKNLDLVVLTDRDKAALVLAKWTGIIGAGLIAVILLNFIVNVWNLPSAPLLDKSLLVPPKSHADAQALLTYYKTINEVTSDQTNKIFDIVITKTIVPIFTLILGFVFGSRTEKPK